MLILREVNNCIRKYSFIVRLGNKFFIDKKKSVIIIYFLIFLFVIVILKFLI